MLNNEGELTIYEVGFKILNKWLNLNHDGKSLQKYFDDNYIKTVAIYGMGELGKRLYDGKGTFCTNMC